MPLFEVLPGLPPYGPAAKFFSATERGHYREGFVVRFFTDDKASWVGNFQRGDGTRFSGAYEHPDGKHVVIVSSGEGYIIDPNTPDSFTNFGGEVHSVLRVPTHNTLLFEEVTHLSLLNAEGFKWRSKRISLDGIRNLTFTDEAIFGECQSPDDEWLPFRVSLHSGQIEEGYYPWIEDE